MATRTKTRKTRTSSAPAPRRPGPRGWSGRGGGASTYVQAPEEWRATTNQACGLWPFAAGTGSPMSGVPLGRNLLSGATLCGDPISWFQDAKLINNPSCFVLGLPAYGKSTLVRRMTLGLAGYGVVPLILGDLKPDYVDVVQALGGQVIRLGRARGYLNVLDPGEATAAAARLTGSARQELIADARGRRHTMVSALITIVRSAPPDDREETFLDRALQVLDERHDGIPVLRDLVQVLEDAPDIVREVALDRGNIDRYRDLIENLLVSLKGMQGSGRVGEIFSQQTTTPMRRDVPVVFDVSSIKDTELHLQGAALMACWSAGFGAVNVAHALSDAGLEPARNYWIVLDEVWRSLRAGLVDPMDGVTRLNRNEGVGQAMITHTMSDLEALPREEDRMKARGFVERAGMVLCGALPPSEFSKLRRVMAYSDAEEEMVAGWTNPPAWDSSTGAAEIPPGCGNFLVKVGGRPGIPFRVVLTAAELGLHDTNKRWHTKSRIHEAPEFAKATAAVDEGLVVSATSRRSSGGSPIDPEAVLFGIVLAIVVVVAAAITAAVHLGIALDGSEQHVPANPFTLALNLVSGDVKWPHSATLALAVIAAALAVVGTIGGVLYSRRRGRRSRVDRAASRMGRGRDLEPISHKQATATAKRLGVDSPGLVIARTVAGGRPLYQGWEDVSVDVWGPRVGKTTSRGIPAILDAPGAALVTSNKRDIVDATRDLRAELGEVWPFDPQGIVGATPDWWWNPLTYVTDEVKAEILADVFASGSRDPSARTDAYFEPAGQRLLANLLLAAALAKRPLTQVYLWLSDPTEEEPVGLLEEHGYPLLAAALQFVVNAPEKQRGGVYGTAQQIASFMTNREAMRWVTADGAPAPSSPSSPLANPWVTARRREFNPHDFVTTSDTLYSLSKEGRGSAGPLVTALTVAICEAAEERAKVSPGGRLPVPLVVVLDEAANVCRWRELPNLYSHYGSRGICMMTILQSWSQGAEVWGRDGMRKLWSAANIKVYGGGVSEAEFLNELSQLIGDFDLSTTSVSHGRGGRSTNRAMRRERILDVADLSALPKGRAIVLASGAPAALVRTLPWMTGPHATAVRASIAKHDPAAQATLAEAMDSLSDVEAQERAVPA